MRSRFQFGSGVDVVGKGYKCNNSKTFCVAGFQSSGREIAK